MKNTDIEDPLFRSAVDAIDTIFPGKWSCFGKIQCRISFGLYFEPLQQNILFIALWQPGSLCDTRERQKKYE